jgi:hypothetical protein
MHLVVAATGNEKSSAAVRRLGLRALTLLTLLPCVRLGAQLPNAVAPTGFWLETSAQVGAAILDENAARPWANIGRAGPSIGLSGSVGLDGARLGVAAGAEVASLRIGDRRGTSLAASATIRWAILMEPLPGWQSRVALGYVRYGFGGAMVAPAELPLNVFRSGASLPVSSLDARLRVVGDGVRTEFSADRVWSRRSRIVMSVGADVVHFTSATYQHYDESLTAPGWGVLPRISLGFRIRPGA